MPVADKQVETIRALLAGNHDEFRARWSQLKLQRAGEWSALVAAACFEAAERAFPSEISAAEVVQYVGDLRARMGESGEFIDPVTAERVIRFNLGDPRIETLNDLDATARLTAEAVIAKDLVSSMGLDYAAFDEFIASVWTYANDLIAAAENFQASRSLPTPKEEHEI
jgi:hypothetical protein